MQSEGLKARVKEFWNRSACGEVYAEGGTFPQQLERQAQARYELEPDLHPFARFPEGHDKDVLEIGVGMGADHLEWAKSCPRSLTGIDLTERAVEFTRARLALYGLDSKIQVGDAEGLPYYDNSFDLVFSYGVLHHTPDTAQAIREVYRVLRPGRTCRIMIYHKHCIVGYMLWARYGLLALPPFRTLNEIYAQHLESPGTKAFTIQEARQMFSDFSSVVVDINLSLGDLLQGAVGQRHRGAVLTIAKRLWPRWFIKKFLRTHGLFMMIEATK
jgi:ubiquinone/menaquinone biosynthesis C-methylase UbiE